MNASRTNGGVLRRVAPLLMLTLAASSPSLARADEPPAAPAPPEAPATKQGPAVGFAIHRYQDDFGLGLRLSSPAFLHVLRVTGAGGVAWYPHGIASDGTSTWDTLYYGSLRVETGPPFFGATGAVRPYGFGGVIALFPPSSLSTTSVYFGGLGGFGLEARFMDGRGGEGPVTYFFEVGGIGTGAKANKLPSGDSVASGFLIEAGLRFYP
jgi:hypothetical protein